MSSERKGRASLALHCNIDVVSDPLLEFLNLETLAKALKERHEELCDQGRICRVSCFGYLDTCLSRFRRKSVQGFHAGLLQELGQGCSEVFVVKASSRDCASATWKDLNQGILGSQHVF